MVISQKIICEECSDEMKIVGCTIENGTIVYTVERCECEDNDWRGEDA